MENTTFRMKKLYSATFSNFHPSISVKKLKLLLNTNAIQKIKFVAMSL